VTTPGTPVRLPITTGQQNVLSISAESLANISEITFSTSPGPTEPLLINVDTSGVGDEFTWTSPNLAGGSSPSYILWNFSTATSLIMPQQGGASIDGTVFAPDAAVQYLANNNIQGNVIAASFRHVQRPTRRRPT
jgi:choice-of-anchor A domain-containing protein